MYNVSKDNNKYGNVIIISISEIGEFELPFAAIQKAKSLKKEWITNSKIRFLINEQILSTNQLDSWAIKEYSSLIKCSMCPTIINNKNVFTHTYSYDKLFCSQGCADKDYILYLEKLEDEEPIEYL